MIAFKQSQMGAPDFPTASLRQTRMSHAHGFLQVSVPDSAKNLMGPHHVSRPYDQAANPVHEFNSEMLPLWLGGSERNLFGGNLAYVLWTDPSKSHPF